MALKVARETSVLGSCGHAPLFAVWMYKTKCSASRNPWSYSMCTLYLRLALGYPWFYIIIKQKHALDFVG